MIDILAPYMSFWLKGAALTVILSAIAFPICIIIGLAVAFASFSTTRSVALMGAAYINVFRGLPEVMVIFIIFYGSNILLGSLGSLIGLRIGGADPVVAAVAALAIQFGSYAAVIFRDWISVLPKGYAEAGSAIGMTRFQIRRRIVVPIVLKSATPALGNLFLVMLKISALASLIGVQELSRATSIISGSTREPLTCYLVAAVMYLGISAIAGVIQYRLEATANQG
ncbi:ABC transporter permease subunit [Phyllobacterium sp. UNC302MFCol5.2]|uniref:amino acid ABC transporter permease n=1 Tax=Phyllobacterium sp. UNC302MFCol5.2 TaxID=1449065 RepID=UPI0009DD7B5F|nr:ABC transporter permease subunit [Phyllobacterium sp. UNC302MFCol5.2]